MFKSKIKKFIGLTSCLVVLSALSNNVLAGGFGEIGNLLPAGQGQLQIFESNAGDERQGHVYQFELYRGNFGIFVPKLINQSDINYMMRTFVNQNKQLDIGQSANINMHFFPYFSSDKNLKTHQAKPDRSGDNSATDLRGGSVLEEHHYKGNKYQAGGYEYRYAGYTQDGKVIGNPYFPNDIKSTQKGFERTWNNFGSNTNLSQATKFNYDENLAKLTFNKLFEQGAAYEAKSDSDGHGYKMKQAAVGKGATPGE